MSAPEQYQWGWQDPRNMSPDELDEFYNRMHP